MTGTTAGENVHPEFVALTLLIERETGYDSLPTIVEHYDDGSGETPTYHCVHPGCRLRRKDAVAMWFHVHMSPKHPADPVLANYSAELADLDPRRTT